MSERELEILHFAAVRIRDVLAVVLVAVVEEKLDLLLAAGGADRLQLAMFDRSMPRIRSKLGS
jgi:hypothetical protein